LLFQFFTASSKNTQASTENSENNTNRSSKSLHGKLRLQTKSGSNHGMSIAKYAEQADKFYAAIFAPKSTTYNA